LTDGVTMLNLSFIPSLCPTGKNANRAELDEKKSTLTEKDNKGAQEDSAEYKIAYS
jgi:phage FluMu protein Com